MNASATPEPVHQAYVCLGSNINPVENLQATVRLLRERTRLLALSTCWETAAVGSSGPNFLNLGAHVETPLEPEQFKTQVLRPIEHALGRVRSHDKYAPRTMDLDITVFDGQVMDDELWRRLYLALIFAELLPDLRSPHTGESVVQAAERLRQGQMAIPHRELALAE